MHCESCDKNEATVHLTEIVNGVVHEFHLCDNCAKVKSSEVEQNFGLADLLAGLSAGPKTQTTIATICKNCGIAFEEFRKTGRLGCSECYQSFKIELASLLKRIHGSAQHFGKKPVLSQEQALASSGQKELMQLKNELKEAIDQEQFEKAAHLRDKIKSLEKGA
ncbi:MAG: UvrB/UvrC motif-containing protein [Candidatus Omnitrophica bacterium]|nr:UvrB/UvrC motif-containing protein [Candidatus Omnitrophota bacterium]